MKKNPSFCKPHGWSVLETNLLRTCNTCTLLRTLAGSLNDVYLLTLITEVEGILNSRPMAMEIINDPGSFQVPFSTIITSQHTDTKFPGLNYRWWYLLSKKYLQYLQESNKWNAQRRNFFTGDAGILRAMHFSRNERPQLRVVATKSESFALFGIVYFKIGDQQEREIAKDIL